MSPSISLFFKSLPLAMMLISVILLYVIRKHLYVFQANNILLLDSMSQNSRFLHLREVGIPLHEVIFRRGGGVSRETGPTVKVDPRVMNHDPVSLLRMLRVVVSSLQQCCVNGTSIILKWVVITTKLEIYLPIYSTITMDSNNPKILAPSPSQ